MNKVLTGIAVAAISLAGTALPAFAHTNTDRVLGGLDLNAYCQSTGQGPNSSPNAKAPNKDWTCSNNGTGKDISLKAACASQYGKSDDVLESVPGNVYSYVCER